MWKRVAVNVAGRFWVEIEIAVANSISVINGEA